MRVLVTGGAGYIGSHVAHALARKGHQVFIYDNLSTGHRFLANGFHLTVGDICDGERLTAVLKGIDAVMHFAASAYVAESVHNPRKYFENNVRAGLTLLNAVTEAGIRYFIFSSTCAVYGIPARLPITEDDVREPVSPYGASKLFCEHALEAYSIAYGLGFVSLRYFNACGADEGGEIGEVHDPETHVIPLALEVAAGIRPEFEIYGDDYPTHDGTCVRDYIHVSDLAEAHVRALEYLASGGKSMALNLGTGRGHSIQEVLATVEETTGLRLRKLYRPRRPGDPPALVADCSLAQRVLEWKPSRTLPDIISSAWRWIQWRQVMKNKAVRRASVASAD